MEADNSLVGGAPQRIIFRSVEPGRGWAMPGADGLVGGTAVSAFQRHPDRERPPRRNRVTRALRRQVAERRPVVVAANRQPVDMDREQWRSGRRASGCAEVKLTQARGGP
jgi:hypothetical protein